MKTYRIVRFVLNGKNKTILTGLTLNEAKEHCNDAETSSSTCSEATLLNAGIENPWFDGYEEEL
jgi:hypothetical protein